MLRLISVLLIGSSAASGSQIEASGDINHGRNSWEVNSAIGGAYDQGNIYARGTYERLHGLTNKDGRVELSISTLSAGLNYVNAATHDQDYADIYAGLSSEFFGAGPMITYDLRTAWTDGKPTSTPRLRVWFRDSWQVYGLIPVVDAVVGFSKSDVVYSARIEVHGIAWRFLSFVPIAYVDKRQGANRARGMLAIVYAF